MSCFFLMVLIATAETDEVPVHQGGKKAGIAGKNQVSQSGLFLVLMLIGFAMVTPSTPCSKRRMASDHFLVGNDPQFLRSYKMDRVENS